MLAITNTLTVFAADKKNKGFKKLSKKIQKERDTDVDKIKEKVTDIFHDEPVSYTHLTLPTNREV